VKLLREGVRFGGVTDGGKWRKHEIDLLRQMLTPLLIGIVNPDEQWMDVFATTSRYFVVVNWNRSGDPREVALMPYIPEGDEHLGDGTTKELEPLANMPGGLWELPIGQPIVRISISDSEDRQKCEEIKSLLESYLLLDQQNAVFMRLGLGYFEWPLIIRTGSRPSETGVGAVLVPPHSPQARQQMNVMCKIVACTLKSYKNLGRKDLISAWLPVLDQLPINQSNAFIQGMVEEVREYMRTA
jgi:hypothetical protein